MTLSHLQALGIIQSIKLWVIACNININIYCSVIQEHLHFTFLSSCRQSQYKNKMKTLGVLCGVLCLALVISQTNAHRFDFTASPSVINPLTTDALTLRCNITDAASSDYSTIWVIAIYFNKGTFENFVARLDKFNYDGKPLQFQDSRNADVTGHIPQKYGATTGYLEVIWRHPGVKQTGHYSCKVTGRDRNGFFRIDTENVRVSMVDV